MRFSFGLGKFQMAATRCLEEVSYWQLHPRVWISSERYRPEITELEITAEGKARMATDRGR